MNTLVALDVDGTLATAGGPVSSEAVRKMEDMGVFWGVLSSRSVEHSREATDAMGVVPHFVRNCRIYQRAEELRVLAGEFPSFDKYLYVADTKTDRNETLRAGWEFCWPSDFDPEVCTV